MNGIRELLLDGKFPNKELTTTDLENYLIDIFTPKYILQHPLDNHYVALDEISAGYPYPVDKEELATEFNSKKEAQDYITRNKYPFKIIAKSNENPRRDRRNC